MAKVVRIKNSVLVAVIAAVVAVEIAAIVALQASDQIGLADSVANQCEIGSGAIATYVVVVGGLLASVAGALYLVVALLSMDGLSIPHIRADIKAEGLYLAVFVTLLLVFSLVIGLLQRWVSGAALTLLSAIFAIMLAVIPAAFVLLPMKVSSYQVWSDQRQQKTKNARNTHTQASQPSNAPSLAKVTGGGLVGKIRRSIDMIAQRFDPNQEQVRLQALRDELEADFDRVQRDLNVQTAAAAKTRQRLQAVRQQIVMVEEEIDVAAKLNATPKPAPTSEIKGSSVPVAVIVSTSQT